MNERIERTDRDRTSLLQTAFLCRMPPNSVARLLAVMTPVSVPARELVFSEGDEADAFYSTLSGYVRLYRMDEEGREANIRICGPGDTFAECLIADGHSYLYNARVAENATLARFDLAAMREIVAQDREVAAAVIKALSRSLRVSQECIADDRLHTAPQRVAKYILANCPCDGQSATLRLPFQKSLLAGMLGLAPEALSRAFSNLREKGVAVNGRVIHVGDVEALRDI